MTLSCTVVNGLSGTFGVRNRYLSHTLACRKTNKEPAMGKGLLLWLIGIPLPIILLIWLFGGLH
jgi:hypothetical protein